MKNSGIEKCGTAQVQTEPIRRGQIYRPTVDILDLQDEIQVIADVPGAQAEDIEVNFEQGELSIHAKIAPRQTEVGTFLLREYGVGEFYRSFRVGDGVAADRINAQVKDGLLTLHLPKTEATKLRRIAVQGA